MRFSSLFICCSALGLLISGCDSTSYPQDYRIKVAPSADGRTYVALPPECPDWRTQNGLQSNQSLPQLGCAAARNLAAHVENPHDLLEGKPLGTPDGTVSASSIAAYRAGKTKALIDPNADAPQADNATGAGIVK